MARHKVTTQDSDSKKTTTKYQQKTTSSMARHGDTRQQLKLGMETQQKKNKKTIEIRKSQNKINARDVTTENHLH